MNKYIKSDIRSGLFMLGAGLGHIVIALINGEINEYKLNIPLESETIAQILQAFDKNISIAFIEDDKVALDIISDNGIKSVYIYTVEDGCLFRT